jgi:hypothetical protein
MAQLSGTGDLVSSSEDGLGTATAPTQFSTQKAASSLSRSVLGLVLVSVALFFWYDIVGLVVEARGRPAESMVQRQRLCVGWRRAWSA